MASDKIEQLKALGNKQFASGDYAGAVATFTEAIALAPENHVLFSNRSAAFASAKDYTRARDDAEACVKLQPTWAKGYGRLGAAFQGLGLYEEAVRAYEDGLKIEPDNAQLKKGLDDVDRAIAAENNAGGAGAGGGINSLATIFQSPDLLNRILSNPKTAPYIAQPDFVEKLKELQADGTKLSKHMSDPRILNVLTMLIMPPGASNSADFGDEDDSRMRTDEPAPASASASSGSSSASSQAKPKAPEPESLTPEEREAKDRKAKAIAEKEKGTEFYRKKDFENAMKHYTAAAELDPDDITYVNNIAAVHFEKGDYEACIKTCEQAVEKGREVRADYKLVARAFGRIGSAYQKLDNLPEAIKYFNKSLTEHRTPEILAKLQEVEKEKKKRDREAYLDPAKSDEAREQGNAHFKNGDWPAAVASFTDAINRNPTDVRNFTNRAATYIKLLAFPEASKDCEEAIRLDPTYVKAYIRKASMQLATKKYNECLSTLSTAARHDTDKKHQAEITQLQQKCFLAMRSQSAMTDEEVTKRAESDPEVMAILNDPVMRSILQQMQQDPRAITEHMKNPVIASKLQKLMDAGVIRTG